MSKTNTKTENPKNNDWLVFNIKLNYTEASFLVDEMIKYLDHMDKEFKHNITRKQAYLAQSIGQKITSSVLKKIGTN